MPHPLISRAHGNSDSTRSSSAVGPISIIVRRVESISGANVGSLRSDWMIAGNHGHADVTPSRDIICSARPGSKCASAK
jgi:hypothetical protein